MLRGNRFGYEKTLRWEPSSTSSTFHMPTHSHTCGIILLYFVRYCTYRARYLACGHYILWRECLHALTCSPPSLPPTSPNHLDRTQKGNVESPILLHLIIYRTALRSTIQCYIEQLKHRIQALIACADAWSPSNFVSDTFQPHWSQPSIRTEMMTSVQSQRRKGDYF